MDDLDEATTKFRFSNFLSNVTLSWIVGLLCLSVPYKMQLHRWLSRQIIA